MLSPYRKLVVEVGTLCFDRESNTGPSDLQSDALPTELSKLVCLYESRTWTWPCFMEVTHGTHPHHMEKMITRSTIQYTISESNLYSVKPTALCLLDPHSNQLSYEGSV